MPADPAVPGTTEVRVAYATAVAASLAWVACVMPGVRLADPAIADDYASPMSRGAIYLVPGLFLLVAVPVAAVIARHAIAVRGLLAWSSAFVTIYAAAALCAVAHGAFAWIAVAALLALAAISVRDALRIGRAGSSEPPADLAPEAADLRLGLAVVVLLTPAGVLSSGGEERASLLVPFVFVAIGAAGERFSRGLHGLRLATTVSLSLVAIHLVICVRYLLDEARPAAAAWTAWGYVAIALSGLVLALALLWTAVVVSALLRGRRPQPSDAASGLPS